MCFQLHLGQFQTFQKHPQQLNCLHFNIKCNPNEKKSQKQKHCQTISVIFNVPWMNKMLIMKAERMVDEMTAVQIGSLLCGVCLYVGGGERLQCLNQLCTSFSEYLIYYDHPHQMALCYTFILWGIIEMPSSLTCGTDGCAVFGKRKKKHQVLCILPSLILMLVGRCIYLPTNLTCREASFIFLFFKAIYKKARSCECPTGRWSLASGLRWSLISGQQGMSRNRSALCQRRAMKY